MSKSSLTAIILTYNEELHLQRCIDSIKNVCEVIVVVDSYSTDKTEIIALKNNVQFIKNPWKNYATQFNWALKNVNIKTRWVLRIDADEYLSGRLQNEISNKLAKVSEDITGIFVKRLMYFMGGPLRKGGMYPIWHIKIWKHESGYCEQRWMDERIKLKSGRTVEFQGDLIDNNLNNITWWTSKHNSYAVREAIDILNNRYNFSNKDSIDPKFFGNQEQRKRWLKQKYLSSPLFIRPFVYWFIRYFVQGGVLEGKRGFIWNILQAFWYRFLVDVKIYEALKATGKDKKKLISYFAKEHGYQINKD